MIKMNEVAKNGLYTVEYLQKMFNESYGECPKCSTTNHLMEWDMKKMCPECGYNPGIDPNPLKEQAFGFDESAGGKRRIVVYVRTGAYCQGHDIEIHCNNIKVNSQSVILVDGAEIDLDSKIDQVDELFDDKEPETLWKNGSRIEEEKLGYGDQIRRLKKKAWKDRDAEAVVFYAEALGKQATVGFDQFKQSWAYTEWVKKHQKEIEAAEKELKRFSYMREGDIDESDASEEAKKLNLVHIGFGNYSNTEGGPITHKTKDGILTRVSAVKAIEEPKIIKKGAEEPPERSEPGEEVPVDKKKAKFKKIGVTDIKLVDEKNQIYTFRYNDHPGRIKLSKKERQQVEKDDITKIILVRIQRKIARIKAAEKAKAEKDVVKQPMKAQLPPEKANIAKVQ